MVQQDKERKKRKIMDGLFYASFMIIPLTAFLVFYLYVNIDSFIMAFQKPNDAGDGLKFAAFENFIWVFKELKNPDPNNPSDNLGLAFINTFKSFGISIVMFPIGLLVSYFIYKKITGYRLFRIFFYLPTIVSGVVVSYFFIEFVGSDFFISFLTKLFNIPYRMKDPLVDSDYANKMVFLNMIWLGFPGSLIIWGGTFSRIPDSIIESAKLDGVNWVQEMFIIILPLVWPTFVLMITLQLANVFGATGAVFLLTQGAFGTQTISNWMYMQVLNTSNPLKSNNLYRTSAMAMMLTTVSCLIAVLVRKFLASKIEETTY